MAALVPRRDALKGVWGAARMREHAAATVAATRVISEALRNSPSFTTMRHDGLVTNRSVRILPNGNGRIALTPPTAPPAPPTLHQLKQRWPSPCALAMGLAAALRTGFRDGGKRLTE